MAVMEQTEVVHLTEAAINMVQDLLQQKNVPNHGLRVFVSGGGCSGMQYGMALEEDPRPFDHVVEQSGIKVFIDPTSMMYLEGATIDYVDSLMGGGFNIENPNAVSTCGCGHSFKTGNEQQAAAGAGAAAGSGGGCGCG
ncbi:MAG TPA: iron-sulfur cluster insertion protein ErpA [Candidatus Sulfomarinibacteraceae bacterium]|nr:iron-sulfur cluster insertion protein ErpA [Candidatus Sulfomarinibacteraceae bacterium]